MPISRELSFQSFDFDIPRIAVQEERHLRAACLPKILKDAARSLDRSQPGCRFFALCLHFAILAKNKKICSRAHVFLFFPLSFRPAFFAAFFSPLLSPDSLERLKSFLSPKICFLSSSFPRSLSVYVLYFFRALKLRDRLTVEIFHSGSVDCISY